MSIKDVLVYLDNDAACANRISTAVDLCLNQNAHLSGVYIPRKVLIPAYAGAQIPVEVFEANDTETARLRDEAQQAFQHQTDAAGISAEFRAVEADVCSTLNIHSRYSDILLVPQMLEDQYDLNSHYELSDVLVGASCPVLMMPRSRNSVLPPKSAMLAWDGGAECARALKASYNLLEQVEKIDVVSVGDKQKEASDIALYLSRHGVETEVHSIETSHYDVGLQILQNAERLGSDVLVMGAYGHSRLRELVLGGVTKYVLGYATLPVLFSH